MPRAHLALAAGAFAALTGCSTPQSDALMRALPPDLPARVELAAVPFFPQAEYQCGPAALATALVAAGAKVTDTELVPQVYLPERKGSLQVEMLAAARRHGMVAYALAPRFEDVLREIAAGTPVVVLQNLAPPSGWHYAVAIGYDHARGELVLRSGTKERQVLPFAAHEIFWQPGGHWAMVAVPPQRIPATADEARWLAALVAFERMNEPRRNRLAYAAFLERWPGNLGAAIGLGNAHYALGELKEAEAVLRQASARDPSSVAALNNLAQTLSDLGRNEEALGVIERAAALGGPYLEEVGKTRETIRKRLGR